ncbi:MAG: hypothetical protein EAX96_12870 [Candidatus Lokiarchaeota archaeon]|nr:hypothetical protein [Candidatus Lokiarchaeota archaeon]
MKKIGQIKLFSLSLVSLILIGLILPLIPIKNAEYSSEILPLIDLDHRYANNFDERVILLFESHDEMNQELSNIENLYGTEVEILHRYNIIPGALVKVNLDNSKMNSFFKIYQAYPDIKYQLPEIDNDVLQSAADIDLNEVASIIDSRNIPYTGAEVNISILDSGIQADHPDFQGRVIKRVSFANTTYGLLNDESFGDDNGHGTHVAGIAAGSGLSSPAGYNMTGIAPDANLLEAKCVDMGGAGTTSSVIAAMEWSIENGAQILSVSLGFGDQEEISPDYIVSLAADNVTKQGAIIVVAAGNEGWFYSTMRSPGNARSVISVGAIDSNKQITNFSSRGPTIFNYMDPDILTPGQQVYSILASNSFIEGLSLLTGGTVGSIYKYYPLSGTSMATPVASGAIALLLEAFPALSPTIIKMALMDTANDPNGTYSQNEKGAGIINITRAFLLLEKYNSTGEFNLTAIYPSSIPQAPFDLIKFPGDEETFSLMVLHSIQDNLSLTVSGNVSDFIMLSNTSNDETIINSTFCYINNETEYNFINLNIYIPINAKLGFYNGTLDLKINSTGDINRSIPINFNITRPVGRIYFDYFHNYDRADTKYSNYNLFSSFLVKNLNYDLDFVKELISYPKLKNYDILMLPDTEIPLLDVEIDAIQQFYEEGGRIYVLGSYYPYFELDSLNDLLTQLNTSILFNRSEISESIDEGLLKGYLKIEITDISAHPITNGVTYINWTTGSGLNISNLATSLMRYDGSTVMAISNNSKGGKILVSGAELHLYNDYFQDLSTKKFINQSISWLMENSSHSDQNNVSCQVLVNNSIIDLQNYNSTEIVIFITNKTTLTGITGLNLDTDLNITVYNNDTSEIVFETNSSNLYEIGDGAYNFTLNLSKNGTHIINASVFVDSINIGNGISAFKVVNHTTEIAQLLINGQSTLDEESSIVRGTGSVQINVSLQDIVNLSEDGVNISCIITSLTGTSKNISSSQYFMQNVSNLNATEVNFTLEFTPQNNFPSGKYNVFILVNDSHGYINYKTPIAYYFLSNQYPTITTALMNGNAVGPTSIGSISFGMTASIEVKGTDIEDNLADMNAFALICSLFLIPGHGYAIYQVVQANKIPYVPSINEFLGSIYIPTNGITSILGESYNLASGNYVLLVLIRDSDLGWDTDSYTYMQLVFIPQFDWTFLILIIVIGVVSIGAVMGFIYLRRRRYRNWMLEKKGTNLCTLCGQQLLMDAQFCIHCGTEVEQKTKMDNIISDLKKDKDYKE